MTPTGIVVLIIMSGIAGYLTASRIHRAVLSWHVAAAWAQWWLGRTAVYKHRFGAHAGHDRHYRVVYVGMTNRPDLRAVQHRTGSWWHPLTDPGLYVHRWYRTRMTAAVAEWWAIRRHAPVGNVAHNPRRRKQTAERERLRVMAGSHRTVQERTP